MKKLNYPSVLFFAPVLLIILLPSCKKEQSPEVVPLASYELSRTFTYPSDNTIKAVSYKSALSALKAKISLNSEQTLNLHFGVDYPNGNDDVIFMTKKSTIKPGYIGEYFFRPANGTPASDIAIVYFYQSVPTSFTIYLPEDFSEGSLTITNYDAKHKTLSGNFTFSTSIVSDPTTIHTLHDLNNTIINISGKFENIALETIN